MRPNRLVVSHVPHHVVLRGNNRRRLFSRWSDFEQFLWYLGRALKQHACVLHALSLMSNHLHLLVTPPAEAALPRLVHSFAQRYAVFRNRNKHGTGKVWEERYRAYPKYTPERILAATAYIDLNGFRGGLAAAPELHRWSTCGLHAGAPELSRIPAWMWTPSEFYLALGQSEAERGARYRQFLAECLAADPRTLVEDGDRLAAIEALSSEPYPHRLVRPNGSRARDFGGLLYGSR